MIAASVRTVAPALGVRSPERLTIATCIDSLSSSGGTELNAVRLMSRLAQRGHRVICLTLNPTGEMGARYAEAGIPVQAFPLGSLVSMSAIRQARAMACFFRREHVDVVHAHDMYSNFIGGIAAKTSRSPLLVSKRWIGYRQVRHRITDFVAQLLADQLLANSPQVAGTFSRLVRRKVAVLPNFVDDEVFAAAEGRESLRRELNYGNTDVVFAIVAMLRSEKQHHLLLQAFARVAGTNASARLLIVGDGPERESLTHAVNAMGLAERVQFVGNVTRAWQLFGAADVAVLSSRHEGSPNALLEAMATGLPVVASGVGGILDIVDDGVNGILVSPHSPDGFVSAMTMYAADARQRATAGRLGQDKMRKLYGADAAVARIEALYMSMRRAA